MNVAQAIQAIRAAGIAAAFSPSDDESCDDQITISGNDAINVQISATRNGLRFCGTFADGEGDDFGVTFGQETSDPVAAARAAIAFAEKA